MPSWEQCERKTIIKLHPWKRPNWEGHFQTPRKCHSVTGQDHTCLYTDGSMEPTFQKLPKQTTLLCFPSLLISPSPFLPSSLLPSVLHSSCQQHLHQRLQYSRHCQSHLPFLFPFGCHHHLHQILHFWSPEEGEEVNTHYRTLLLAFLIKKTGFSLFIRLMVILASFVVDCSPHLTDLLPLSILGPGMTHINCFCWCYNSKSKCVWTWPLTPLDRRLWWVWEWPPPIWRCPLGGILW